MSFKRIFSWHIGLLSLGVVTSLLCLWCIYGNFELPNSVRDWVGSLPYGEMLMWLLKQAVTFASVLVLSTAVFVFLMKLGNGTIRRSCVILIVLFLSFVGSFDDLEHCLRKCEQVDKKTQTEGVETSVNEIISVQSNVAGTLEDVTSSDEVILVEETLSETLLRGCTALSSFFPSRGGYDASERSWLYPYVSVLIYICFFYFMIQLWGQRLVNALPHVGAFAKNKYVFWCTEIDETIRILAKSIQKEKPNAHIVICLCSNDENASSSLFSAMTKQSIRLIVQGDETAIPSYCQNAKHHFFFSKDEHWNLQHTKALNDRLGKNAAGVTFYIKTNETTGTYYTEKWAEKLLHENGNLDIQLFNESELIARSLVRDYPLLDAPGIEIDYSTARVSGAFSILLLGFGHHGKAILKHELCDCQFLNKEGKPVPIKVDIVDKDIDKIEHFFNRYPDLKDYCKMDFSKLSEKYQQDVLSESFKNTFLQNMDAYNRIIVCLGDDKLNRDAVALIESYARINKKALTLTDKSNCKNKQSNCKNKLCVVMGHGNVLQDMGDSDVKVNVIGSYDSIYSYDNVVAENEEILGKVLDWAWRDKKVDDIARDANGMLQWRYGSSYFDRKSSMSQAAGFENIKRLIYSKEVLERCSRTQLPSDYETRLIKDGLLETLAECEHLRWNVFHFAHGIACWDICLEKPVSKSKAKDFEHNRHAALVSWKKLLEVDQYILNGRPLQENDRITIRMLPTFFNSLSKVKELK